MIQDRFNIKLVKELLKTHPNASNNDLYQYCNARTNSQKSNVRRKKLILLKRKIDTRLGDSDSQSLTLTSADLERRIIQALNQQPNNAQILGKAIDFFIKVKGVGKEALKDEIDMEALLDIGIAIKSGD